MSNVIAFPVNDACKVSMLGELDIKLAQERMEDARDKIQDALAKLIALQDDLAANARMASVDLPGMVDADLPAECGWA
ncbi:hypothetical protein ACFYE9_32980 [Rhizobium leguminosarum]|uniref:Uncharacterized protein n=2 Tax=Rhizobium leguminosarum TaxID=384 RepID=A0A154I8I7_RHILE|nr:hypothetical protein [Rhizobium leguminosarum]KZA96862.1 hypothetical protein A4A59_33955 [Rhizobium leguminosarum]